MSRLGTSSRVKFHFGPITESSFCQAPLHFHPCSSFIQEKIWVRVWLWHGNPLDDALSFFGGELYTFLLPNDHFFFFFAKVPLFESWESLTSQVFDTFRRVSPTTYILMLHVCIVSAVPQGCQFFSPPNTQIMLPSLHPPIPFPSQVLPFSIVVAFFSVTSETEASFLGPFSLLNFLSSVDCILCILYFFYFFFQKLK